MTLRKATYVPPRGNPQAKIALCGEQPGQMEVRWKPPTPFVGPAGQAQDECLMMAGIARLDCYLTNVIKDLDRPLKHYIDLSGKYYSISEDGWTYINELKEELIQLNPNVVVAYGNVPLVALCNRKGITNWRGSILESTLVPGLKVIPTFHPATIIQPKFNFLNKPLICFDLKRALHESKFKELRREPRNIRIKPSFAEAKACLETAYQHGLHGQTIDLDIEVINEEVDCISFAWNPNNAISIPFRCNDGDYFPPDQELEIMLLVAAIIEDERVSIGGANFTFDTQFLLHRYGIRPRGSIHCTQIAQKIAFPDYFGRLDFVTSMHTDIPYYKQDGKKWIKMGTGTWEEWWNYNGMDSIATSAARPKQIEDLRRQQNLETYERQRKLIPPLLYMMERGIRVDVEGMMKQKEVEEGELDVLKETLNKEVGHDINHDSPKQVMDYFYRDLGIKPYRKKNSKNQRVPTADVDALKRLSRRGYKAAKMILDLRGLSKRISTYMDVGKVDKDGRYRCAYNPVGAETGRLSSSKTIFGTGGNLQNWPHDLLRFLLFDEGYIGYSIDLSQIENRIVAYVGNIIPMIEAFESGKDLHRLTAALILGIAYDDVSDEDESSDLGDGRQSQRFWGKKGNHCKTASCQVLTRSGWISIAQAYYEKCEIAQWSKDKTITFVYPSSWFRDIYTGKIHTISNQRIFQQATPEHRMPLLYKDTLIDKYISHYPKSGKYKAPLSGIYDGPSDIPDPLIRLIVAFQADGSWNHNAMRFSLKKKRKINRLKAILNLADIPFKENSYNCIDISAKHDLSKFTLMLIGKSKTFGSWLLNLSQSSLRTFLDELPYWDGYVEKNQYFTINKVNAEWVQTVSHLCNMAANISIQDNSLTKSFGDNAVYKVRIRSSASPTTHAIIRSTHSVIRGRIYCPTVPSGYFLCRENGKVSVTGNSLNYDLGYKEFSLKYETTERDGKWIVERYHYAYPGVRQNYHAMIINSLLKDRTLVNLFGRHRVFLGPVHPRPPAVPEHSCRKTYKEAFAQIPQSTTADKINEHGVEYIYYNQDLFKPIELLNQVHDSTVFQIPLSVPWIEHARMVKRIQQSLEIPLTWHDTKFVVPADISIGLNMGKKYMIDIKSKDVPSSIEVFADKIRDIYARLKP